jgi:hypothetical protein
MDITVLLGKVKLAMRMVTNDFDSELTDLINAGFKDLGIAGVNGEDVTPDDSLITQAIITYCKMNFGYVSKDDYARLKASYDEQKAQISMATGYTVWTVAE